MLESALGEVCAEWSHFALEVPGAFFCSFLPHGCGLLRGDSDEYGFALGLWFFFIKGIHYIKCRPENGSNIGVQLVTPSLLLCVGT